MRLSRRPRIDRPPVQGRGAPKPIKPIEPIEPIHGYIFSFTFWRFTFA